MNEHVFNKVFIYYIFGVYTLFEILHYSFNISKLKAVKWSYKRLLLINENKELILL